MPRIADPYSSKAVLNAESLLEFDGTDDSINLGDNPLILFDGADFSFELIFSTTKGTTGTLLSKNSLSGGSIRGFELTLIGGNDLRAYIGGEPGGSAQSISIKILETDRLYHLVVGINSGNFFAYLNGQEEVNTAYTGGDLNNTADLVIGKPTSGSTNHEGTMGLLRGYSKALDNQEVLQVAEFPYAIPSDLHEYVICEYIPQRSYFKDAGNSYGFGTDSILIFDSSDQYNYLKRYLIDQIVNGTFDTDLSSWTIYDLPTIRPWVYDAGEAKPEFTNPPNVGQRWFMVQELSDRVRTGDMIIVDFEITEEFDGTGVQIALGNQSGSPYPNQQWFTSVGTYSVRLPYTRIVSPDANESVTISAKDDNSTGKIDNITVRIDNRILGGHGVLTGWTDAEVVTAPEPTKIIDFYNISSSLNWTDDGGDTHAISKIPPLTKAIDLENDWVSKHFIIPSTKAFDMDHANGVTWMNFMSKVDSFNQVYTFHHYDFTNSFRTGISNNTSGSDRQLLFAYNPSIERMSEIWFNDDYPGSSPENNLVNSEDLLLITHIKKGSGSCCYVNGNKVEDNTDSGSFNWPGFNGLDTYFYAGGFNGFPVNGYAIFYAMWGKELTAEQVNVISSFAHSGRFPLELNWVRDKLYGLWIYHPSAVFDNGGSDPEIKNLAPVENFPHGSANSPEDWNHIAKNWSGADVANKISDMQFANVAELK